ncbi:unnamed protein product [Adineta steineri]|uniref:Uncharacterized protein n=1 Tax=Adineta steineri TaxID=433720 RepID=A0A814JMS4_9BILA|nr:unnamed protein product [Adineta steineri]CAF1102552.1 unnamed protein product [Adineta steineri]
MFNVLTLHSFADILKSIYREKKIFPDLQFDITNGTCYTHLKCDRGPQPLCLDWREVCDGKIDCLNGSQDETEILCSEFEKTECSADQYRCRNGMQCIPGDFYRDAMFSPDCLDRTDEIIFRMPSNYPLQCQGDVAFRCEETMCTHPNEEVCGYGVCSDICSENTPGIRRTQALVSREANMHLQDNCWHAIICLLEIEFLVKDQDCECRNEVCVLLLEQHCLYDTLPFPLLPIAYGHVRLVYSLSIRQILKECTSVACRRRLKTPDYICYRLDLCPLLTDSLIALGKDLLNDSTLQCYRTDDIFDIFMTHNANTWLALVKLTTQLVATCLTHVSENASKDDEFSLSTNSSHSTLYRCIGMNKYISKNRLLDGTYDCYFRDDEDKNNHKEICSYKYRYKCAGMNDICISSINILDGKSDCPLDDDEKQIRPIHFTLLCDGFVSREAAPDDPEKETDESNCEEWSCNNQYTRCDGQWQCDNGEDETNCPGSPCSPNHHLCISINTFELICLPLALTNNGIIDCFGASDERSFCREEYPSLMPLHRYRCNDK